MLRPTESATLFLQQLGRGLRRDVESGKALCTVLDFVGLHRREFRFDLRYRALLGGSRQELLRQVERNFPFLPAGCHLELDPVARDVVLQSIKSAVPGNWPQRVAELRSLGDVGLAHFLQETGLDLDDVYANNRRWTELRRAAGFAASPAKSSPYEATFLRAMGRLLHVDDDERLKGYAWLVSGDAPPDVASMTERDRRLLRMLVASMFHQQSPPTLDEVLAELWSYTDVRNELVELLGVLAGDVTHVQVPLDEHGDVPLTVHARYTRREIQAAFGDGDKVLPPRWDSGVKWLPDTNADLLAFTLDKSSGDFSPTTRYRDYAISRDLIHWESQSTTSLASPTGQRYLHHVERGSQVMLFARVRADDRAFWFLGPAEYGGHEGERPIAVTWRLQHRLPADPVRRVRRCCGGVAAAAMWLSAMLSPPPSMSSLVISGRYAPERARWRSTWWAPSRSRWIELTFRAPPLRPHFPDGANGLRRAPTVFASQRNRGQMNPTSSSVRSGVLRLFTLIVLLAGGLIAMPSGSATAVGCWGDYCSGRDPVAMGCDAGAYTVAHTTMAGTTSRIELRWSPTCKTNWTRVAASWGRWSPSSVRAIQCPTGYTQQGLAGWNSTYAWSPMIYSPTMGVRAAWVGSPGSKSTACG